MEARTTNQQGMIANRGKRTVANSEDGKHVNFATFMRSPAVLTRIEGSLGSASKRMTFVSSLISAVNTNDQLLKCEPATIVSAALLGESLKLPPSPQLGYFYMVPFKQKAKNGKPERIVATFQMGYRGYIQLAMRSGQYKKINVVEVHEEEFISWDPFQEELKYRQMLDRESSPVIGYYAFFELINGGKKCLFWTKEKMLNHADEHSAAFNRGTYDRLLKGQIPENERWKYSSFWYKDFDQMALKTMIRQIISKWGPMSVEMVTAFENDYSWNDEMNEKGKNYADNDNEVLEVDYEIHEEAEEIEKQEETAA